MTWLHLTPLVLAIAALVAAHRASDWFGAEGASLLQQGWGENRAATYMMVRGWIWQLTALLLVLGAGFIVGRIL